MTFFMLQGLIWNRLRRNALQGEQSRSRGFSNPGQTSNANDNVHVFAAQPQFQQMAA